VYNSIRFGSRDGNLAFIVATRQSNKVAIMQRTQSGRRDAQWGAIHPVVVIIIVVIVIGAIIAWGVYSQPQYQVTKADASGAAHFKTPETPVSEFDTQCQSNGGPAVTRKYLAAETKDPNDVDVSFKNLGSVNCKTTTGQSCKQQEWEVEVRHRWHEDLGKQRKQDDQYDLGKLVCPCTCPPRILELVWKDIDKQPYPNGELATYYDLQLKLTDVTANKELATWTEWVRIPGGHTHYGDLGFKQFDLSKCPTPDKPVECAKRELGQEFASPPK
jgi:hypothetical protein